MFSTLRLYIYAGVTIAALATITGAYVKGRVDEKSSIYAKLQADKIKIIKDGKEIDEKVLQADDDELCQLLGGCAPVGLPNDESNHEPL